MGSVVESADPANTVPTGITATRAATPDRREEDRERSLHLRCAKR